jgi:hypothetical protein
MKVEVKQVKKAYVEPKMAELGNISTITLGIRGTKGASCPVYFPIVCA